MVAISAMLELDNHYTAHIYIFEMICSILII